MLQFLKNSLVQKVLAFIASNTYSFLENVDHNIGV
jgi:hypothetical protein